MYVCMYFELGGSIIGESIFIFIFEIFGSPSPAGRGIADDDCFHLSPLVVVVEGGASWIWWGL